MGRLLRLPPIPEIPEPLRGGSFVLVEAAYLGDEAEGARLVEPLRALGPALDTFAMIPAPALQKLHMGSASFTRSRRPAEADRPTIRLMRCAWAAGDPLLVAYHDEEWGVPSRDDRHLFELLTLEGAQAGLSWLTILRKRDGYRSAFAGFDPAAVAQFGPGDVERLLGDAGIVRNRGKIESAVDNARSVLEVQEAEGSFSAYVWSFVGGEPLVGRWTALSEIPSETAESRALSKDLKRRGFRFVGPTIVYAFMQACGLVDDHTPECFRRAGAPEPRRVPAT